MVCGCFLGMWAICKVFGAVRAHSRDRFLPFLRCTGLMPSVRVGWARSPNGLWFFAGAARKMHSVRGGRVAKRGLWIFLAGRVSIIQKVTGWANSQNALWVFLGGVRDRCKVSGRRVAKCHALRTLLGGTSIIRSVRGGQLANCNVLWMLLGGSEPLPKC